MAVWNPRISADYSFCLLPTRIFSLSEKYKGAKIMTLGEKIAKQRKELNYTQEQLADVLGVSRQSISKWESEVSQT